MATIKDFYDVYGSIADPLKDDAITVLVDAFYGAVVEEMGLLDGSHKFAALPYTTVLGKKAQAALEVLKASVKA